MDVVAEGLARAYPQSNEGWGIRVQELREQVLGGSAGSLWMLFGGVGLVLLIACVNVASLMVARGAGRKQELAVRVALGASRGQLLRQLLTENLLLALVGGALGVGVAYLGLEPMKALMPSSLADIGVLSIDRGVLAFALLVSAVTGLVSGAIPGFRLSGSALSGGRIVGVLRKRPGGFGARSGLVVAEFALAMILLVGAGLFVRSLANLYSVDLGFEPSGTTTFGLTFPTADYRAPEEVVAGLDAVLARFAADVEAIAATSHLPLAADRLSSSLQLDGDKEEMSTNSPFAAIKVVSPGYFELLGIPLIEGRFLNDDDDFSSEPAVVINESAARRFWPSESAVGRVLAYTEDAEGAPVERRVVGVVGDILWAGPQGEATEEVYQSHRQTTEVWQWSARTMSFVARAGRGETLSLSRAQGMVSEIDPNMPVVAFRPYGEIVDGNVAAPRFQGALLGLFAALALFLAAVGTYSVMAFSVRQRTREIGVRLAVGADRAEVMASVLLDGAKLALVGVAVGTLGALLLSRLISSLLWGVGGSDPLTYVVVAAVLSGVTLLASYVPARRASCVDPMVALRDE
jgi:putative ABC transport system permease protein